MLLHLPAYLVKRAVIIPNHVVDDKIAHRKAVIFKLLQHTLSQLDTEGFSNRHQNVPRPLPIPDEVDDLPRKLLPTLYDLHKAPSRTPERDRVLYLLEAAIHVHVKLRCGFHMTQK